ncbi:MAG: DUF2914 domain-containing protein [Desulfobacterales bacterium]
MQKFLILFVTFVFSLMASVGFAEKAHDLKLKDIQFCTAIENKNPFGVADVFVNTTERIYCYTTLEGAAEPVMVWHLWYHNDQAKASIRLGIKGSHWRTWSSKKIIPGWSGKWRVDVVKADGTILGSKKFIIKP